MKRKTFARLCSSARTVADGKLQPIVLSSAPLAAILVLAVVLLH